LTEHFAPTVLIDGRTLQPQGWMWVLSFALAGCEWADEEMKKPEFKAQIAAGLRAMKIAEAEAELAYCEAKSRTLRVALAKLQQ
jgi:hypothetical protein